jgi:signal transduction histidine kinase
VLQFAAGSLVALLALVGGGAFVGGRLAEDQVRNDVRHFIDIIGRTVVAPRISAQFMRGNPRAQREFHRLVTTRLIPNTAIRRVKIWSPDGTIVYSDAAQEIGRHFTLEPGVRAALRDGTLVARVSDLDSDESEVERSIAPQLIEVYAGVTGPDGHKALFEAYVSDHLVHEQKAAVFRSLAVMAVVGLAVFMLFQMGLGAANLRWLQLQRRRLAERGRAEAERERRRVARDLHDGVVQDLVSASYAVDRALVPVAGAGLPAVAEDLRGVRCTVRASIQGLRSMMIDLYPAGLRERGLCQALTDLAEPLRTRGMSVEVDVAPGLQVDDALAALLFRCAQTAVRNVALHAEARRLLVRLHAVGDRVELLVRDDGVGLQWDPERGIDGHLGLHNLQDFARESSGLLEVASGPGAGTEVRMEFPR